MSWLNDNFISRFFVTIINWFYSFTGSYLLAVILFTLVIRLLLLPLDIRQRKAQQKQAAVAGKVKEIQERFKHDPAMAQRKVQEFYKKNNIKMTAGCLPMLLQLPILFAMFGAITILSNVQMVTMVSDLSQGKQVQLESALWVHNIWRPDTGTASVMPSVSEFSQLLTQSKDLIGENLITEQTMENATTMLQNTTINQLALISPKLDANSFFGSMAQEGLNSIDPARVTSAVTMNYNSVIAPITNQYEGVANGWYIFPLLAGGSMFALYRIQRMQQEKAGSPQAGSMKSMEIIMPIFIIFWASSAGVCFAFYWMLSNLYSLALIPLTGWLAKREEAANSKDDEKPKKQTALKA